jgi:hypothetical protein
VVLTRASHEEARKWLAKKLLVNKRANIELVKQAAELRVRGEQD